MEQQLYSLQILKTVAHSKGRHYCASFALQANLFCICCNEFGRFSDNRIKLTLFLIILLYRHKKAWIFTHLLSEPLPKATNTGIVQTHAYSIGINFLYLYLFVKLGRFLTTEQKLTLLIYLYFGCIITTKKPIMQFFQKDFWTKNT